MAPVLTNRAATRGVPDGRNGRAPDPPAPHDRTEDKGTALLETVRSVAAGEPDRRVLEVAPA